MSDEELKQLLETQAADTRRHFDETLEAMNQRLARATSAASDTRRANKRISHLRTLYAR